VTTKTGTITEADIMDMAARGILREVVNGQWVDPEVTGREHGRIETMIIYLLMQFIVPRQLGELYSGDTTFIIEGTSDDMQTIRMPDVAFVEKSRLSEVDVQKPLYLAPDLAIEIVSPSETASEIQAKVSDYRRAGVKQIWQVYPTQQQVIVTLTDGTAKSYSINDSIPGGDVLPGFELKVKDIFTQ
jgi:Uma2 family endonuclease